MRGVAIARVLLTDGCSPLYRRGEAERLRNTCARHAPRHSAIARVLLTDGCSPLYRRGEAERLRNTCATARTAP